jgi:hypothetical protein
MRNVPAQNAGALSVSIKDYKMPIALILFCLGFAILGLFMWAVVVAVTE